MSWWQDADWIVRSVFMVLIGMSVASWTVFLYKARRYGAVFAQERRAAVTLLERGGEPVVAEGTVTAAVLREIREGGIAGRGVLAARLERVLIEERLELENGLTWLATVGNSAPFIGLFGTVWGIMHALQGLGGNQQLSMDMVAGPVAEALVATAAGLFAAVPAVMGYNYLVRRLRRLMGTAERNALRVLDRVAGEG